MRMGWTSWRDVNYARANGQRSDLPCTGHEAIVTAELKGYGGIPAGLPLHDSVLTAEPGAVAGFMREESERVLKRPLPVKIQPAGPELLPL